MHKCYSSGKTLDLNNVLRNPLSLLFSIVVKKFEMIISQYKRSFAQIEGVRGKGMKSPL